MFGYGESQTFRRETMKKVLAAAILMSASVAFAACPTYAPYGCVQTYGGKMKCGCGVR
jgi:hypothetical protein